VIGVDTNVLVRYLTQDEPRQAAAATRLIEQRLRADEPGFLSSVVLAEVCWVLRSLYKVEPDEVAAMLLDLTNVASFQIESRDAVLRAIARIGTHRAECADALIHELAAAAGCTATYTFHRAAARSSGMTLLAS
jgi:predicted nucleic-acid-binding protein